MLTEHIQKKTWNELYSFPLLEKTYYIKKHLE